MSRRTQDVLVYSGLLAVFAFCMWVQHRVWRKGEDRLVAIERRLQLLEYGQNKSLEYTERITDVILRMQRELGYVSTNVVVQQDATGSRTVRWPTNAPSGAQRSGPPTPRP